MTTSASPLAQLGATWHSEIPLTAAMSLVPLSFEHHALTVRADLEPNINVHGTAFAGSLYAIAALSGWGLVHLELDAAGLDASIVIAHGEISYLRPVQELITARCETTTADADATMTRLRDAGRTRWNLTSAILANGEPAVEFRGVYAIKLRPREG